MHIDAVHTPTVLNYTLRFMVTLGSLSPKHLSDTCLEPQPSQPWGKSSGHYAKWYEIAAVMKTL